ncbi:MAG TPA: cytochrome c biogenesis protein CcsA [Bryobacteraceae bacterium]|nr:cytochrome c biogenesis protein CcsA [Bryobacteraceae bacterium]
MVSTSIFWLRVAVCFYAVGLLHSMLALLGKRTSLYPVARGTFRIGAILQGVALVDLGMAAGHIPVDNFFQTLNLCAFLIAVLFLAVEWRYHFASTAVAHFPLVFLMTLVAAMERPVAILTGARETWLAIHIVLVLAGYAALAIMAAASFFYLIQERRLKTKKSLGLFQKLPPLATLDNLVSRYLEYGFVFITMGVIIVFLGAGARPTQETVGDPRVAISLFTWALLLATLYLRTTAGWRGRRAAAMALAVMVCSAITWFAHVGLRIP